MGAGEHPYAWPSLDPERNRPIEMLVGFTHSQSPLLEAFRTLRSNLRFFQTEDRTQVLLVTSGLPQEGKSVNSVNLALSLSMSGARVVLWRRISRRPMLHMYLDLDNRVGVSTVLSGAGKFSDCIQVVPLSDLTPASKPQDANGHEQLQKNLLCMTSGPLPPNPSELLGSPRMSELISFAAAHADYVIIDTPPLLLVSDALELSSHADGIIVAARMRNSTTDEANDVRVMLERSGSRVLGLVANGVNRKRRGYYRGHYKGYYASSRTD